MHANIFLVLKVSYFIKKRFEGELFYLLRNEGELFVLCLQEKSWEGGEGGDMLVHTLVTTRSGN